MATDENVVTETKDDNANKPRPSEKADKAKSKVESAATIDESKSKDSQSEKKSDTSENDKSTQELEEIREKLAEAEEKAAANWEEVLRARADLENTRKRMERDIENAHKFAVEKFVQGLLPVIDSLEMGVAAASNEEANISTVREGTELTLKMFGDCVEKFGLKSIDPEGENFDPEFHQAMSIQESDEHEPDTVITVMQKGYLLNGRLIRPAMVVVAKAANKEEKQASEEEKPDKNS